MIFVMTKNLQIILFDPVTNSVRISRNVVFNKTRCQFPPTSTFLFPIHNDSHDEDSTDVAEDSDEKLSPRTDEENQLLTAFQK